VYAFMQNVGVVNDHVHGCFRAADHPTTARML
jgi:DNA-3-methyladenine glycosylase I